MSIDGISKVAPNGITSAPKSVQGKDKDNKTHSSNESRKTDTFEHSPEMNPYNNYNSPFYHYAAGYQTVSLNPPRKPLEVNEELNIEAGKTVCPKVEKMSPSNPSHNNDPKYNQDSNGEGFDSDIQDIETVENKD